MTGRVGVDGSVAEDHVGVGYVFEPETARGIDHHLVPLRELGGAHLHSVDARHRVREATDQVQQQRRHEDQDEPGVERTAGHEHDTDHVGAHADDEDEDQHRDLPRMAPRLTGVWRGRQPVGDGLRRRRKLRWIHETNLGECGPCDGDRERSVVGHRSGGGL